jgi:hypothetical protein
MTQLPDWNRDLEHDIRQQLAQKRDELLALATDKMTAETLGPVSRLPEVIAWIKRLRQDETDTIETLIRMDGNDIHRAGWLRGRIRTLRSVANMSIPSAEQTAEIDALMAGLRQEIERLEDVLKRR